MPTELYGCDSLDPVNNTLASEVKSYFGSVGVTYWGRYLINNTFTSGEWNNSEIPAVVSTAGCSKVLPIDETGHVGEASFDQGASDGNGMVQKVQFWVTHPSGTNHMYYPTADTTLFLDVEEDAHITTTYWQGWSFGCAFQDVNPTHTFHPCAYIGGYATSSTGTANGNTIADAGGCFGMWGTSPPDTAAGPGGVGWPPPYGPAGIAIRFWQYHYTVLFGGGSIDLDASNPTEHGPKTTDSLLKYLMWVDT